MVYFKPRDTEQGAITSVKVEGNRRSGIFLSCSRRPVSMNSVLEGLKHRRFEVQSEKGGTDLRYRVKKDAARGVGRAESEIELGRGG